MAATSFEALRGCSFKGRPEFKAKGFSLTWRGQNMRENLASFAADARILAAHAGILPEGKRLAVEGGAGTSVALNGGFETSTAKHNNGIILKVSDGTGNLSVKSWEGYVSHEPPHSLFATKESRSSTTLDLAFSASDVSWDFDTFVVSMGGLKNGLVRLPLNRKPHELTTEQPLLGLRLELKETADPVFWLLVNKDAYDFLHGVAQEKPYLGVEQAESA